MKHKGTVELNTERLILRRFDDNDAIHIYNNWASQDEVTKYLMWPTHSSVEVSQEILNLWIDNNNNNNFYQWAIVPKYLNEPIGTISVVNINENIKKVHIGYSIGKEYWSKGYTSEAFMEVIKFLFEEINVNRIEARFDPRNIGSGKVMEKCGLVYEGTLRQSDFTNSGICDASYYSVLAEDYFKKK